MQKNLGAVASVVAILLLVFMIWSLPERNTEARQRGADWYRTSQYKEPMESAMRLFAHGAYNDDQKEVRDAQKERDRLINEMRKELTEGLELGHQAKVVKEDWHYLRDENGVTKHASTPPPTIYIR
jgi:hypothetical protein